jgi:hypothetical protein
MTKVRSFGTRSRSSSGRLLSFEMVEAQTELQKCDVAYANGTASRHKLARLLNHLPEEQHRNPYPPPLRRI